MEEEDLATLLAAANPDRGRRLYIQCRACHTLVAEGNQLLGPNLLGFLDRPAGTQPGYEYSEALLGSDITWTPETLDHWMRSPSEVIPGNKMIFAGIRRARDRADLIAYLQQATTAEQDLPGGRASGPPRRRDAFAPRLHLQSPAFSSARCASMWSLNTVQDVSLGFSVRIGGGSTYSG